MNGQLPAELTQWLRCRQLETVHRQLLVVSGERDSAEDAVCQILQQLHAAHVACVEFTQLFVKQTDITNKNYRHYLGQEFDTLIYNAYAGIRANALMALSGTVKAQGLMILICPPLESWPEFDDPERVLRTSYGFAAKGGGSRFIKWLLTHINADANVAELNKSGFKGQVAKLTEHIPKNTEELFANSQQKQAVDAILRVLHGHRKRPLVLTADRGRGKSSSLGIAAGLMSVQKNGIKVLITAPRLSAVEQAFFHARRANPEFQPVNKAQLHHENASFWSCRWS